jgi:hypothetical protein
VEAVINVEVLMKGWEFLELLSYYNFLNWNPLHRVGHFKVVSYLRPLVTCFRPWKDVLKPRVFPVGGAVNSVVPDGDSCFICLIITPLTLSTDL